MSTARLVYHAGLLQGELQQFNRLAGGPIANYMPVTGNTVVKTGAALLYGAVIVVSPTANINFHDGTSTSGPLVAMIPSGSALGPTYLLPTGIQCANGIYVANNNGATTLSVAYV